MSEYEALEVERYELEGATSAHEGPASEEQMLKGGSLTRRQLLGLLGGGILVLACGPKAFAQRGGGQQVPQELNAWIHISPEGQITVFSGKAEVGQNVRTSVAQAAAEELRVPITDVKVVLSDTDLVPYDMGTFGSRSTPQMVPQIRRAAAQARETLLQRAAEKWGVQKSALKAQDGAVVNGSTRATYGELAKDQPLDGAITEVTLTPVKDWQVLGKSAHKVNAAEIVTGTHKFAIDQRRSGMLYAKVLRAPSMGATLTSVDTSAAKAMSGVQVVEDGGFVAVAAPTQRLAERALFAISAEWKEVGGPASKDLVTVLRGQNPPEMNPTGDKTLKGTYTAQYIAHVPLEPRAALAEWDGKKMTVHTGSQRPFGVRGEVAEACGLEESAVRVIIPDTGSGYGGKHSGDAAVEAARIAKALGKPVMLAWTRPEEFAWAYFRPGGVVEIASGVSSDGKLTSWEMHNYNSGGSALETPYEVASPRHQFHRANSPLRQGSYRGLAATFNNFAREAHMDELAHAIGMDPLEFRLKNLANPRLTAVLEAAAKRFVWKPGTKGVGLACGVEKGSYVATCAEVALEDGEIKVKRAVTAYECGAILNPDLLLLQVEGAVVQGLGGALFEKIDFEEGRVVTDKLSMYRVPRFSDMPAVMETVLLDRKDLASAGAGETPIIAIAPAIANALFTLTGKRATTLPLKDSL